MLSDISLTNQLDSISAFSLDRIYTAGVVWPMVISSVTAFTFGLSSPSDILRNIAAETKIVPRFCLVVSRTSHQGYACSIPRQ